MTAVMRPETVALIERINNEPHPRGWLKSYVRESEQRVAMLECLSRYVADDAVLTDACRILIEWQRAALERDRAASIAHDAAVDGAKADKADR